MVEKQYLHIFLVRLDFVQITFPGMGSGSVSGGGYVKR